MLFYKYFLAIFLLTHMIGQFANNHISYFIFLTVSYLKFNQFFIFVFHAIKNM